MRECGSCALCCKLTEVPELRKPINIWCKSCDGHCACKIYDKRPPSCRTFECGWYKDENILDNFRPDRVNVLIEKLDGYNVYLALVDPDYPDAWKKDGVLEVLTGFVSSGISVVVGTGRGHPDSFLLSEGRSIEGIMNDLRSFATKHNIRG